MFNRSLSQKFSAFLALLALLGCCLTVFTLSRHLNHQAKQDVQERAELLLTTMQAARNYTRDNIQPMLEQNIDQDEDDFIPESIPNFAARTIFADFRQHSPEFNDFLYKEAAPNPTNPEDQTDEFEAQLIAQMKAQRQSVSPPEQANHQADSQPSPMQRAKLSGYRSLNGEKLFYLAQPLIMDDAKCLTCHGRPSEAPQYLLDMYGSEHGFNWQLNDVVAAQMMYVPADKIFQRSQQNLFTVTKTLLSIFGALFLFLNLLLWRTVNRPLGILTKTAKKISSCSINQSEAIRLNEQGLGQLALRRDEPGQLARAFEYMLHVLSKREQDLQQAVQERTQSLELEMRDRQTAQEALQTYSHAINHDLRNMVMGISNLLQVMGLRREQAPSDTITLEPQALEMMQKSCDRQLKLMNSLMNVQSSEMWCRLQQVCPVSLWQLGQEMSLAYANKLKLSNSSLEIRIDPNLPRVKADPDQIQRVFENLIGNAMKYNPNGVAIVMEAQIATESQSSDSAGRLLRDRHAEQLYCTVSDNGIGIREGHELFQLYQRGQSVPQTPGQGLGLYICRKIIEAHGGEIGFQPSPSGGAEIWLTLPLA